MKDWPFRTMVTAMILFILGILGFAAWSIWSDYRDKDACTASGGLIVAATHGDGWSCVHTGER